MRSPTSPKSNEASTASGIEKDEKIKFEELLKLYKIWELEGAQKRQKREEENIKVSPIDLANVHCFLNFTRIFEIHKLLYTSCVGESLNRAMLLSLAPIDHFDKKRNLVETIEGALIVFTDKFKPFLEAMPSETIMKEDFDFIGLKLSGKKPKITKLEFLLLFVLFLKMHSSLDDHEASIMRINFIVDIF